MEAFAMATRVLNVVSGRIQVDKTESDSMKFRNGDVSLSGIVRDLRSYGKYITLPNKSIFMEAISNANWK
jgi:hypothetical protein